MPSAAEVINDIKHRYEARTPLIALLTPERERAITLLKEIVRDPYHVRRERSLYTWTCRKGIRRVAGPGLERAEADEPVAEVTKPEAVVAWLEDFCAQIKMGKAKGGLFVLCDFANFLVEYGAENVKLIAGLRDIAALGKLRGVSVILLGPTFPALDALDREVLKVALPLPGEEEARYALARRVLEVGQHENAASLDLDLTQERADAIIPLLLGLTEQQMEQVILYGIKKNGTLGHPFIATLIDEKKSIVNQSGALTWFPPRSLATVGGYQGLLEFLEMCARTYTPAAREAGVRPKKGVVFLGQPGTGKDHVAKALPGIFNMPLYMLDASFMGAGGSRLGAAELEFKNMLAQVELQPSLLCISEFEKVFGGLGSAYEGDGGATRKVGALFLTWQSDQQGCFVVATMNDMSRLEPEQLRGGRFDHLFFFDNPDYATRQAVAAVHLRAGKQEPRELDLDRIADLTDGFSCAEIATMVNQAVTYAFIEGPRRVRLGDIEKAVKMQEPSTLARMMPRQLEENRRRARDAGAITVNDLGRTVRVEDLVAADSVMDL